ncbi:universal stress protein [Thermococcus sp.]|uniref:universal stress protein n=1 Tax=Thermococcus sp. TaxID=35749 RepID=UPI00260CE1FE|nr:universal stress protein [Thermococcus sp.]
MRILVLIDGSKWSQKAALHAFAVAKPRNAKVVLFSVLDRREVRAIAFHTSVRSGSLEEIQRFEEALWRENKRGIKELLTSLLELGRKEGINCSFKIVEGPAKDAILQETNSEKYSLIVMGAYGKSGKTRIGSILEEVVGSIKPPVMIVR